MAVSGEKINRMIETVRIKCATLDEATRNNLNKNLDIDFEEHFQFQEMQAHAHAMGLLSQEAALVVYNSLGEVGSEDNGGWDISADLPTKIIVTQLMGELLERRVKTGSV